VESEFPIGSEIGKEEERQNAEYRGTAKWKTVYRSVIFYGRNNYTKIL
jgi:hypothetical protein